MSRSFYVKIFELIYGLGHLWGRSFSEKSAMAHSDFRSQRTNDHIYHTCKLNVSTIVNRILMSTVLSSLTKRTF